MSTVVGRWMRLESALSRDAAPGRPVVGKHRRFNLRRNKDSSWVVLYPGVPAVGDRILVRLSKGGTQGRYVQAIIRHRNDGTVVAVSKSPVPRPAEARADTYTPPPAPPPMLKQRNPRVCEECEGPCRPGAGICDGCKRGARTAADGVVLRPGPEPEDVFQE